MGAAPFTQGLFRVAGLRRGKVNYMNGDSFSGGSDTTTEAESESDFVLGAQAGHTYVLMGQRNLSSYAFGFKDKGANYR